MKSQKLVIQKKVEVAEGCYVFEMILPEPLPYFPGQFVVLRVDPKTFRSYSIVEVREGKEAQDGGSGEPGTLVLLIDVRVGGPASHFFEAAGVGSELGLIGKALGKFVVHDTGKPKVFVATGTGLAPFVPMVKFVLSQNPAAAVRLYFGCRYVRDDYSASFFEDFLDAAKYPNFTMIHCISRPEQDLSIPGINSNGSGAAPLDADTDVPTLPIFLNQHGRVTDIVPLFEKDMTTPEFYLCGNPAMVDDITKILRAGGAEENIFGEKYG